MFPLYHMGPPHVREEIMHHMHGIPLLEEKKQMTIPKLGERAYSFILFLIHYRVTVSTTNPFHKKYCRTHIAPSSVKVLSPKL